MSGRFNGFTIVELLVVVVVIGIIATISAVSYSGIQTNAAVAVLKSDLKSASTELEVERVEDGSYPSSLSALNDGQGLRSNSGTDYRYSLSDGIYCLSAKSDREGVGIFHISSSTQSVEEGPCPGHSFDGPGDPEEPEEPEEPEAPNTPITLTAEEVWTLGQVYDYNPNWYHAEYTFPGGSFGAQAIALDGVAYRWTHYSGSWPVDIAVAKPSASNLSSLVTAAQAWGSAATWGSYSGYAKTVSYVETAQVFHGGYWIAITQEAGDMSQIISDVIGNLP